MENEVGALRTDAGFKRGKPLTITVDDRPVRAYSGETVAAALCAAGIRSLRRSAKKGEACGMYCGMGVCFGCRVTIDDVPNVLACQTNVNEGMRIRLQEGHGRWKT